MNHLKQKLEKITSKEQGNWAIVVEDLDKNERFSINGTHRYYAASIIKLPIMATVFSLVDHGRLSLNERIEVKQENIVGGSGVLQYLSPSVNLTLYDLIILMIIQSDNTATNIIIEKVGKKKIQDTMKEIGMVHSSFYNKLMTIPVKTEGRNMITANDVSILLERFAKGKFSSHYACEQMITIMKRQQIHYLTACFPENGSEIIGTRPFWMFASKTGSVTETYHDTGILYVGSRTVTITVLSEQCNKNRALHTLSKVGKEIFNYVTAGKQDSF